MFHHFPNTVLIVHKQISSYSIIFRASFYAVIVFHYPELTVEKYFLVKHYLDLPTTQAL